MCSLSLVRTTTQRSQVELVDLTHSSHEVTIESAAAHQIFINCQLHNITVAGDSCWCDITHKSYTVSPWALKECIFCWTST